MSSPALNSGTTRPHVHDVPEGWRIAQLGDVATSIQGGRLHLTKERHYRSSGVAAFSAAGNDGYVELVEFRQPGIVLSAIGAQCGKCFYADGTWTTLANTQAIIPRSEEIWPRFLFHRVVQPDYWPKSGTAQPFIKPSDVRKCWIAFPLELHEQRAIAAILDSADEAIAKTQALIAKLEAIKQGLLHDLLSRGLDENGELRDPERHPERFRDSEIGRIPKPWDVFAVKDVGRIVAGATPSRSLPAYWGGEVPWITPTDMTALPGDYISGGVDSLTRKGLGSCAAVLLPAGSIVVTTRASLGLAAITCCELATNQGFKNVIPDRRWDATFLCYRLRGLTSEMVKRASGTTFLEVSGTQFGQIRFPAPRLDSGEQERIGQLIRAQAHRIEVEMSQLSKLMAIKKGLMQDLLTGAIRVPSDMVPASATG